MMALLTSISAFLGIKAFMEKLMYGGLILVALWRKENVAAKCGKGTFELIATGDRSRPKLP